jgi:hypothetical protein
VMAPVSSRASLYYSKLSVITLRSGILLSVQKQCYVVVSTVTESVEIQWAVKLVCVCVCVNKINRLIMFQKLSI